MFGVIGAVVFALFSSPNLILNGGGTRRGCERVSHKRLNLLDLFSWCFFYGFYHGIQHH